MKLTAPFLVVVAGAYGCALAYENTPPNSFSLFCTYDVTYRVNATIEVDGRQYSSQVTHQQSRSRKWIETMNGNGCKQTYGMAVPFRLADDRVVLLRSRICRGALRALAGSRENFDARNFGRAMSARKTIDLTQHCSGIGADLRASPTTADGYLVDNAEHPTRWHGFGLGQPLSDSGEVIRLVAATAQAIDTMPADDLAKIAPGVLKATFRYQQWWDSPEAILSYHRRYDPEKKAFAFVAEQKP